MTWPIGFLVLGLGLLVAEVFLPSAGLLGTLAATSLVASLYCVGELPGTLIYRWAGLEAALVGVTWLATFYGLPRTRLGRRVYLQPPTDADLDDPGAGRPAAQVGRTGRALTPLRPSGTIDVEGRRVEAMAESGLIGVGTRVLVVAIRSGRAVVREV